MVCFGLPTLIHLPIYRLAGEGFIDDPSPDLKTITPSVHSALTVASESGIYLLAMPKSRVPLTDSAMLPTLG